MAEPSPKRYLQYLPAIFQRRPVVPGEPILGQFLAPFEKQYAGFEEILAWVDRNFSASFATAEDFLPWLAQWVALVFDEAWDEDTRRRLLAEAMELYRWRGTVRGLKRYLELCLGLRPEEVDILESRWPGGMQIDVASRIGYAPNDAAKPDPQPANPSPRDYYVVDTVTPTDLPAGVDLSGIPAGERVQFYYDARFVQRITFETDGVRLYYLGRESGSDTRKLRELFHRHPAAGAPPAQRKPNIRRRNGLIDYRATRSASIAGPGSSVIVQELTGGTLLVGELERPYRFIVDIHRTFEKKQDRDQMWQKVRALLDIEKPAHTQYYVRFMPGAGRPSPRFMQIEVRSTIGLDTTVA